MSLEISNPWWLLLIPVVVAGLIVSAKYFRTQNKGKKIKYIVMRGIIMLLLILTLCGLSIKMTSRQITTLFLVDMSDSNERNLEDVEAYIRTQIEDMPKKNRVGVVVFGDDVLVDQFITDKKIFTELTSAPVSTATNLEKAVSTALSIFPDDSAKRLVIITDGLENAGSIEKMAGPTLASDVGVKVVKLTQSVGEEVYVSDVELPDYVHEGDTFNVKVTIESNVETQAVVSLYSGRTLKGQSTVNLTSGTNQFVFQDTGEQNGTQDYRVMVEPVSDTVSMNNEYCAFTQVESEPKILVIEGTPGEGARMAEILEACGVDYNVVTPSGAPTEMSELIQYKAIITVNVNVYDLRAGFMDNLEGYVKDYAGGLICTGGDNSFAMGAYQDTAFEEVLPVEMHLEGEREVPTMAVVMVIDHSGSMTTSADGSSNATCLDLAKQAAIAGAETMRPQDKIGVLAFDDAYEWAVPVQDASDQVAISNGIARIAYGGGTSIYPALNVAADELNRTDAQIKHIILLTDGQDYYDQYSDVINKINNGGITLSTVAVGADSDQGLLQSLATQCDGRFYYTDVSTGLPKIFEQEIILSGKSYIVNEEFVPVITSNSEIIEGLMTDGVPTLLGYIGSTAKDQATVILQSEKGDPILSAWQYGLGRTIAWNTDAKNEWTANWAGWDNYVQLWDNMINYVVSNTSVNGDSLEVVQEGKTAVISYTTDDYNQNTSVKAICTDVDGNVQEIMLDPVAPGQYQATMDMENMGVYTISLQNYQGERVQSSMITAAAMQYSPEYRFDLVSDGLDSYVSQVNGSYITYEDSIFEERMESVRSRANLALPFMLAALILLMLDIAARRLNVDYFEWMTARKRKAAAAHATNGEANHQTGRKAVKKAGKKVAKQEIKQEIKQEVVPNSGGETDKLTSDAGSKKKADKQTKQRGKQRKQEAPDEQGLNMEELLKKKEERQW